ncbi:MAG: preprotein translocase subunit SecG [Enterobacteriaceae bacterium]
MYNFILFLFLFVSVFLIILIMFQQNKHCSISNVYSKVGKNGIYSSVNYKSFFNKIITIFVIFFFFLSLLLSNMTINS